MPSSADDSVGEALGRAADAVMDAAARAAGSVEVPVILIDGRSGSGKTTLAAELRRRWTGAVQVVALDDVYPGWDGLAEGADRVRTQILEPVRAGVVVQWRRWDWAAGAPGDSVVTLPAVPLIVEGVGVLTAASARLASIRVWLESPELSRRDRALARDGDTYRPHWRRWAAQEESHLAADHPRDLATIVVEVP